LNTWTQFFGFSSKHAWIERNIIAVTIEIYYDKLQVLGVFSMKLILEIASKVRFKWKAVHELRSRFGTVRTLRHLIIRLINTLIYFDCWHIIVLDRQNLKSFDLDKTRRFSTKIATLEDLKEMEKQGCWDLPPKTFECFNRGDSCLLSYLDNNLAGYTWVLGGRCQAVLRDLKLIAPEGYLYNWAGFTLPEYRGFGLQSFRHHELLNHPRWKDKKGLVGYVKHTNYSSKRGQSKSGFERIGKVYVIGWKSHLHAIIGKNLLSMGFKRMKRL
jgi:hypothetical protein